MKISYKVLMFALIPFTFSSTIALSDDTIVEQLSGERKASSNDKSSVSTDRRASSKKKKSTKRTKSSSGTTTTNSAQYSQEDCATQYIKALDRECYNTNRIQNGGVYSDCSDKTMADYYDVMDMQLANVVGIQNFATYKSKCDPYKGYALEKWLSSKGIIETSAVKGSNECITATKKLTAAKKCYTAALAHDGNFFEFGDLMNKTCGEMQDVAKKFSKAGDLGIGNIPQMLENYSTLQFTNKSSNWRQAVEATLAGYIYDARQACGELNYDIMELNQFTEDKRENILSQAKDSFASEVGKNLGKRTDNLIKTGSATIVVSKDGSAIVPNSSLKFYKTIDATDPNTLNKNIHRTFDKNGFDDTTPQIKDINDIANIYVIEDVSSINKVRARLLNIIKSGNVGSEETKDDIDYAIITGLGGRANSYDTSLYEIISNLDYGDTFVIKDSYNNCQVLMLNRDGNLENLLKKEILKNKSLNSYVSGCQKVIE